MAKPDAPKSEYSRSAVPDAATVSGWRIALIKLGIVIALPAFVTGAQIGSTLGLRRGAIAVVFAGLVLTVMAGLTGAVAARSRLSTSLITQFAFGRAGGRLVNAVLALTLLGWFGVTAQIFAESLQGVLQSLNLPVWPLMVYVVLGGGLMVVTTIFGFSALQRLSDVTVPLLLIVVLTATWRALQAHPLAELLSLPGTQPNIATGVAAVVGGLSASICVFPDLCRFARTPGDARLAGGLTFGLGLPLMLILAAIISIATAKRDLIAILTTLGLGAPALILLVFKAWATNSGNLYSASLGLATIFRSPPQTLLVMVGGSVGVLLAALGITSYFIPFLLVLSITIPPIAGLFVSDFFLLRGRVFDLQALETEPAVSWRAFVAWGLGVAVAAATSHGLFTLTGMSAADSVLISVAVYLLLSKYLFPRPALAAAADAP